ncbi:MAG: hypothetical protein ACPGSC_08995 [Granulosicoccaceae bacterium]
MKTKLSFALLAVSMVGGCSSIVSKSDYPVTINSVPANARFSIVDKAGQNIDAGTTPATVTLKASSGYFSGQAYTITLDKEGYGKQRYELVSTVDGWYFGNILIGGLLGMLIVDPITGAMYQLPERLDIELQAPTAASSDTTLELGTIDALSKDQVAMLQRLN